MEMCTGLAVVGTLLDVELRFFDALCGFAHVLNEDDQALGWLADCNSLNATYLSNTLVIHHYTYTRHDSLLTFKLTSMSMMTRTLSYTVLIAQESPHRDSSRTGGNCHSDKVR